MERPLSRVGAFEVAAALVALLGSITTAGLAGQVQPSLEVVSIRRTTAGPVVGGGVDGRRYRAPSMSAASLIAIAYRVPVERIIGGPDWIRNDLYEIAAQAESPILDGQLPALIGSILRERFNLTAQVEQREVPAYALVASRPDGSLGPRLRRNPVDCADQEAVKKATAAAGGRPVCSGMARSGSLSFSARSLNALAAALVAQTGRPVVNRTGLSGSFDIDLDWGTLANPDSGASIFTAVQEQLGLKLESTTARLDVVVVERIERPSEN